MRGWWNADTLALGASGGNPVRVQVPPFVLMRNVKRVTGPWTHSNGSGRKIVMIVYGDGSKECTSYARYLMEQHLGRELGPDETVDHVNEDPSDDRLENLQLLSREENARKSAYRGGPEMVDFLCAWCACNGRQEAKNARSNNKKGRAGPFCSRRCAGQYGAAVQNAAPYEKVALGSTHVRVVKRETHRAQHAAVARP